MQSIENYKLYVQKPQMQLHNLFNQKNPTTIQMNQNEILHIKSLFHFHYYNTHTKTNYPVIRYLFHCKRMYANTKRGRLPVVSCLIDMLNCLHRKCLHRVRFLPLSFYQQFQILTDCSVHLLMKYFPWFFVGDEESMLGYVKSGRASLNCVNNVVPAIREREGRNQEN